MKKATLNSKMKKLSNELIKIKEVENFEALATEIITEIFPTSFEIHSENIKELFFYIEDAWEGVKPPKKEMLKLDNNFKGFNSINGIDIATYENKKGDIILCSTLNIDYFDKWEHSYNVDYRLIEQVI